MYCTKCGAKIDNDAAFCEECGATVKRKTESNVCVPQKNAKTNTRPFILIILLTVFEMIVSDLFIRIRVAKMFGSLPCNVIYAVIRISYFLALLVVIVNIVFFVLKKSSLLCAKISFGIEYLFSILFLVFAPFISKMFFFEADKVSMTVTMVRFVSICAIIVTSAILLIDYIFKPKSLILSFGILVLAFILSICALLVVSNMIFTGRTTFTFLGLPVGITEPFFALIPCLYLKKVNQ